MTIDALLEANCYYNFKEIMNDPNEYCKLTDYLFSEILNSKEPELKNSRDILMKIKKRELYKFISEVIVPNSDNL